MNKPTSIMFLLLFFMMLLTLISRQQHFLLMLLCLEGMMLFMIMYLPLQSNYQLMNMSSMTIILLTMSVSSASIGLATIIMMCRNGGNDTMTNNMQLC